MTPSDIQLISKEFPELLTLQETFFNTDAHKRFWCPSRIHWGVNTFKKALVALHHKKALIIYDTAFSATHFIHDLQHILASDSHYIEISKPPSPENLTRILAKVGTLPGVVIALGGGSTLDAAKCLVALVLYGNIDGIGMGGRRGEIPKRTERPLMVAFPSTAGTGAENSRYYVTYSEGSSAKVHGKSWALIFDWVFLDPEIAIIAPMNVKIESAFDAFVHLTESFLCMHEESWPNSALCLASLEQLRLGLDLLESEPDPLDGMIRVQSAASMAGVAISNVRTGHIHEMAGAFLEVSGLNHPQTLAIFFAAGLSVVEDSSAGEKKLQQIATRFGCSNWQELLAWWKVRFLRYGIWQHITKKCQSLSDNQLHKARDAVIQRTSQDLVWNDKECPTALTLDRIERIFNDSISQLQTQENFNVHD